MKNWGIRTRVLLLTLSPVVTIAVLLAGYLIHRVSSDFELELHNYGLGLSRQLASLSEFSVYSADRDTLHKLALAALDEKHVTAVAVFDDDGSPIASSGALPARLPPAPRENQPFLLYSDADRLLFAAPITLNRYDAKDSFIGESAQAGWPQHVFPIGWITLELSRSATQKRIGDAVFFTSVSTLFVLLLAGSLAVVLGRQVTEPILRLESAVIRIQEGDLSARVPADSGGDLQRLEEGMNAMAEALSENREQLEVRIQAATRELEEKKNEAERSSLAKSRFLAATSHDLRQPLHALSLFAADLRNDARTVPQQRLAGQINDSVSNISGLLDALLDISRLDMADIACKPVELPLSDLFDRIEASFSRTAQAKSLVFRCRPTRLWVHADPTLLLRLLNNLVANAIRYTDSGSVMLAARKRGKNVRIEVRDSGAGIAPEHHQAVFQEFFQVHNRARVQGEGLGLGLAIVSRLARILGTRVDLCSAPARGSVFALTLPPGNPLKPPAKTRVRDDPPRLMLLLGAENSALREVARLAENWGFNSASADAIEDALRRAKNGGMVLVGMAETLAAAVSQGLAETKVATILLGGSDAHLPPNVHHLPLPLRPAKLRALLTQLLATSA